MYDKFGDFGSSLSVLNSLQKPNTKVWNLMMKSAMDMGLFEMGIFLYGQMRQLVVEHDCFTLPVINQLYSKFVCDVRYTEMMHCVGIQMGFSSDVYFCNTLIGFYVQCGCTSFAQKLFDEMSLRDLVSWTSLISGYISEGNQSRVFELFGEMRRELEPNSVTVITMLKACSAFGNVILGNQFHGYLLKKGFLNEKHVRNVLLQMYTNKGTSEDVEVLFSEFGTTDVVTWNIMLSFNFASGNIKGMLENFPDMLREVGPCAETLTLIASALVKYGNYSQCQELHCFAMKSGLYDHIFQTCLMDLYANFGHLDASISLFQGIPCQATITWSTLMSGFIKHGNNDDAIGLFKQLQSIGVEPTLEVIKALLDVCSHTCALSMGKEIHGFYIRNLYNPSEISLVLGTSMLNMYIRCGSISSARHCFGTMVEKDVVAWTSMIEGLGTYGFGLEAIAHFDQMLQEGIEPNAITFLSILSACSHAGLTNEGCILFNSMRWKFGIDPELNHYTCVVDLLGRTGNLKEALVVILKHVVCPDGRIWGALLSASRVHMDRKLGEYAAKCLLELEPDNVGYHIVLSNMQASAGQWTEVEELRTMVTVANPNKSPGWSCVETNGEIQGFVSGDRSHFHVKKVYEVLGFLSRQIQCPDMYRYIETV